MADVPEYTHLTTSRGPAAVVVRVHNTNPLLDYYLARDHGSSVLEVSGSLAGSAQGEVGVRLDMNAPDDISLISLQRADGWVSAEMGDPTDIAAINAAKRRLALAQELAREVFAT